MADILLDVQVKGQQSVVGAVKSIATLQSNVKLLSGAFQSGNLSQRQYYKGITQLATATGKSEKELRKYANELRKAEKESIKAAAATKQFAQARREATEIDRRLTLEKKKATLAADEQATAEERLRQKFVAGHQAQNIYSKELNDLAQARKLDIITAEEQTEALQRLNLAMKNGTGVFTDYGNGLGGGTKKQSKFGVVAQQTGYQVGDFLVQIQSGANPMMAFGQQATQLVGVMGLFGGKMVMAGAALGIIIPLVTAVAGYFLASSKAANEASKKADKFADSLSSARQEVVGMKEQLKLLENGFKNAFELTLTDAVTAAERKLSQAKAKIEFINSKLSAGGIVGGKRRTDTDALALKIAKEAVVTAERELILAKETERQLSERKRDESVINQLHEARIILREKEREAADARDALGEEASNLEKINALHASAQRYGENSIKHLTLKQRYQTQELENRIKAENISGKLADRMRAALLHAQGLERRDIASGLASAAGYAKTLAEYMSITLGLALQIERLGGNGGASGPDAARSQVQNAYGVGVVGENGVISITSSPDKPKGRTGGGGGGGGASAGEKAEDYLRKLELENKLKRESIGLSEEAARILEITTELEKKGQPIYKERIALIAKEEMATQALIEKNKEYLSYVEATGEQFRAFGESLIDGTTSIEDAFKGLLNNILKSIWDKMVGDPLADLGEKVGSFIFKSIFPSANGNVFSNGSHVQAFANGGVVGGPTMFPMNGGKTGLMGEAGPEAIMPLKRGANGKLGVQMEGGGATQVTQIFNINGNGDEYIMGKIKQAAPAIQEATKASIVQDRRRGGTMKQAFRG